MNVIRARVFVLVLLLLTPVVATAQPAEEAAGSGEDASVRDAQKETKAKEHFERGIKLFDEKDWGGALAEFLASRDFFPTQVATRNAAVCLTRLRRYDEALELYEALLTEFPKMSDKDRDFARRSMAELSARVGFVDVVVTEPDASITVAGRERGKSPLGAPVRVPVGSHLVRVIKTGFAPFEKRVAVAAAQTAKVNVRLEALTRSGRLRVTEQKGQKLDVLVDNVVMGKTPWEGQVEPGAHTVVLVGEGDIGTQPAAANVRLNQVTSLNLAAEPLRCHLRVEPTPVGATVSVDSVSVGRGVWEGKLRCGEHLVEVGQEGFLPYRKSTTLPPGKHDALSVRLERDPNSPIWGAAKPSRVVIDLHLGAAFTSSVGGELADGCAGSCAKSVPFGGLGMLHAGYRFGSGIGISLNVGYLMLNQNVTERTAPLFEVPDRLRLNAGRVDDELRLRGLLLGADASYQRGDTWMWMARLGGGVFLGTLRDTRSGSFFRDPNGAETGGTYEIRPLQETPDARFAYVAPEFRVSYALTDRFELSLGLKALILVALTQPNWVTNNDETEVLSQELGLGEFGEQTLMGKTVWLVSPGIGAGYAF